MADQNQQKLMIQGIVNSFRAANAHREIPPQEITAHVTAVLNNLKQQQMNNSQMNSHFQQTGGQNNQQMNNGPNLNNFSGFNGNMSTLGGMNGGGFQGMQNTGQNTNNQANRGITFPNGQPNADALKILMANQAQNLASGQRQNLASMNPQVLSMIMQNASQQQQQAALAAAQQQRNAQQQQQQQHFNQQQPAHNQQQQQQQINNFLQQNSQSIQNATGQQQNPNLNALNISGGLNAGSLPPDILKLLSQGGGEGVALEQLQKIGLPPQQTAQLQALIQSRRGLSEVSNSAAIVQQRQQQQQQSQGSSSQPFMMSNSQQQMNSMQGMQQNQSQMIRPTQPQGAGPNFSELSNEDLTTATNTVMQRLRGLDELSKAQPHKGSEVQRAKVEGATQLKAYMAEMQARGLKDTLLNQQQRNPSGNMQQPNLTTPSPQWAKLQSVTPAGNNANNSPKINPSAIGMSAAMRHDQFTAKYSEHLKQKNMSIDKPIMIGGKEIDLFNLYQTVGKFGGSDVVRRQNMWQGIAAALGIINPNVHVDDQMLASITHSLASVYTMYLADFERVWIQAMELQRQRLMNGVPRQTSQTNPGLGITDQASVNQTLSQLGSDNPASAIWQKISSMTDQEKSQLNGHPATLNMLEKMRANLNNGQGQSQGQGQGQGQGPNQLQNPTQVWAMQQQQLMAAARTGSPKVGPPQAGNASGSNQVQNNPLGPNITKDSWAVAMKFMTEQHNMFAPKINQMQALTNLSDPEKAEVTKILNLMQSKIGQDFEKRMQIFHATTTTEAELNELKRMIYYTDTFRHAAKAHQNGIFLINLQGAVGLKDSFEQLFNTISGRFNAFRNTPAFAALQQQNLQVQQMQQQGQQQQQQQQQYQQKQQQQHQQQPQQPLQQQQQQQQQQPLQQPFPMPLPVQQQHSSTQMSNQPSPQHIDQKPFDLRQPPTKRPRTQSGTVGATSSPSPAAISVSTPVDMRTPMANSPPNTTGKSPAASKAGATAAKRGDKATPGKKENKPTPKRKASGSFNQAPLDQVEEDTEEGAAGKASAERTLGDSMMMEAEADPLAFLTKSWSAAGGVKDEDLNDFGSFNFLTPLSPISPRLDATIPTVIATSNFTPFASSSTSHLHNPLSAPISNEPVTETDMFEYMIFPEETSPIAFDTPVLEQDSEDNSPASFKLHSPTSKNVDVVQGLNSNTSLTAAVLGMKSLDFHSAGTPTEWLIHASS